MKIQESFLFFLLSSFLSSSAPLGHAYPCLQLVCSVLCSSIYINIFTVYRELNACVKRMRIASFDCMCNLLTRIDLNSQSFTIAFIFRYTVYKIIIMR